MDFLIDLLSGYTSVIIYILLFLILTLCGVGIPLPEDIPLIVAGYLAYSGEANLYILIIVSLAAIMLGDTLIYYFGKKFGYELAGHRFLRRIFTSKRLARAEHFFQKHHAKAIFFARFIAGVRAATFFTAGMMKVRYLTFISLDFLAALLSVPFFILISYYFGENFDYALQLLKEVKHYLTFAALVLFIGFLIYYLRSENGKKETPGSRPPR